MKKYKKDKKEIEARKALEWDKSEIYEADAIRYMENLEKQQKRTKYKSLNSFSGKKLA